MKIFEISVVDNQFKKISFRVSVIRTIAFMILGSMIIDFIPLMFKKKCLHDIVANTDIIEI